MEHLLLTLATTLEVLLRVMLVLVSALAALQVFEDRIELSNRLRLKLLPNILMAGLSFISRGALTANALS